jgi:predicted DNA-binding protein (MmcQ/YjbR family)
MARAPKTAVEWTRSLREAALKFPGTEEGVACEGTALEKRTVKVRGKAFLFLGPKDLMLKLVTSLDEVNAMAANEPARYKVGAHGWVTITHDDVATLPHAVIVNWIQESYRLAAPKKLAEMI